MQIRVLRSFLLFLLVFFNSRLLFSQDQTPVSDPQAVALAQQSIAALTNGVAVSDVTLTGNATVPRQRKWDSLRAEVKLHI